MKIYPVKENPIGSAVSEILRYKHTNTQTHRQPNILLLYYKDYFSFFLFLIVASRLALKGRW